MGRYDTRSKIKEFKNWSYKEVIKWIKKNDFTEENIFLFVGFKDHEPILQFKPDELSKHLSKEYKEIKVKLIKQNRIGGSIHKEITIYKTFNF